MSAIRGALPFTLIISTTVLMALLVAFIVRSNRSETGSGTVSAGAGHTAAAPGTSTATLVCVFNNLADQTPRVGFYFRVEDARSAPIVSLLFQREQDGSQASFGGQDVPSPHWIFDGSGSPATIREPEGDLQINLYGYDPGKPGAVWFEAGLRSIRYRNLGGRCRQDAGS